MQKDPAMKLLHVPKPKTLCIQGFTFPQENMKPLEEKDRGLHPAAFCEPLFV